MEQELDVPEELKALTNLIRSQPTCFSSSGSSSVNEAALRATKFIFDVSLKAETDSRPHIVEFLTSLTPSEAPETRSQASKKRKRDSSPLPPQSLPPPPIFEFTPITSLFTDGMDDGQLWAQLDLRLKSVCDILDFALDGESPEDEDQNISDADEFVNEQFLKQMRALESGEGGMDVDGSDDEDEENSDEELGLESEEESDDDVDLGEAVTGLRDPSSDEDSEPEAPSSRPSSFRTRQSRKNKFSELDDGFFDLAAFNAETGESEARSVSRGQLDGDESDNDEAIDLFAPIDVTENFDEEDEDNPGELFYKDFFESPRQTARPQKPSYLEKASTVRFHEEVRVKNIKAKGKNLPLNSLDDDEDEDEDNEDDEGFGGKFGDDEYDEEGEDGSSVAESHESSFGNADEAIERLKDDLFAEEKDEPPEGLSTHEQRMAALLEQISSLEAENIGPKDWVLMGEAGARTRPQNSLLEEDLDFERVMKAVPVVTEERVQALEERIKARIAESRFDDVVRIRPLEDKPFLPSRFFELQDRKSTQSLAQIYEADYVATQSGTSVNDRDGNLEKEHAEIEALWESICGKLDALCNVHFVPKQPKAIISSISNVSTATMESALPTTKSATSMLAPEEVFATGSSELRSRSELTPAEKKASRSKMRKAKKKNRDTLNNSVDKYAKVKGISGVKKQKQAALVSVVKTGKGVTVVGKEKMGKSRPRKA